MAKIDTDAEDTTAAREVLSWGSDLTGALIGGVIGASVGGPVGGALGGLGGVGATRSLKLLADFAHRQLSARERIRVGAAFGFAIAKIQSKIDAGQAPRMDGFFDSTKSRRSKADTILDYPSPPNECIKVYGTTLDPKYNNECR
jgi:hypothetical protein